MKEISNVPKQFENLYYFRGLDLEPELFKYYPSVKYLHECRELYRQGWFFHRIEDAYRVREIMRRAYVDSVMAAKGSDNIIFKRPLCP